MEEKLMKRLAFLWSRYSAIKNGSIFNSESKKEKREIILNDTITELDNLSELILKK